MGFSQVKIKDKNSTIVYDDVKSICVVGSSVLIDIGGEETVYCQITNKRFTMKVYADVMKTVKSRNNFDSSMIRYLPITNDSEYDMVITGVLGELSFKDLNDYIGVTYCSEKDIAEEEAESKFIVNLKELLDTHEELCSKLSTSNLGSVVYDLEGFLDLIEEMLSSPLSEGLSSNLESIRKRLQIILKKAKRSPNSSGKGIWRDVTALSFSVIRLSHSKTIKDIIYN